MPPYRQQFDFIASSFCPLTVSGIHGTAKANGASLKKLTE